MESSGKRSFPIRPLGIPPAEERIVRGRGLVQNAEYTVGIIMMEDSSDRSGASAFFIPAGCRNGSAVKEAELRFCGDDFSILIPSLYPERFLQEILFYAAALPDPLALFSFVTG